MGAGRKPRGQGAFHDISVDYETVRHGGTVLRISKDSQRGVSLPGPHLAPDRILQRGKALFGISYRRLPRIIILMS